MNDTLSERLDALEAVSNRLRTAGGEAIPDMVLARCLVGIDKAVCALGKLADDAEATAGQKKGGKRSE